MKSKAQKREEAIERNAQYRDKYLKEAEDKGYVGIDAKEYADRKQGISAKKVVPTYTWQRRRYRKRRHRRDTAPVLTAFGS